ncbi:hypothetical protein [Streptomyces sp. NPDC002172]
MNIGTRSSPQERVFAFLEESDRHLADEAPEAVDWSARARMIAALADDVSSTDGDDGEPSSVASTQFETSTDTRN